MWSFMHWRTWAGVEVGSMEGAPAAIEGESCSCRGGGGGNYRRDPPGRVRGASDGLAGLCGSS